MKIQKILALLTGIMLPFSMIFAQSIKDDFDKRPVIYGFNPQRGVPSDVGTSKYVVQLQGLIDTASPPTFASGGGSAAMPGGVKYIGRLSDKNTDDVTFKLGTYAFVTKFTDLINKTSVLHAKDLGGVDAELTVEVTAEKDYVVDGSSSASIEVTSYRVSSIKFNRITSMPTPPPVGPVNYAYFETNPIVYGPSSGRSTVEVKSISTPVKVYVENLIEEGTKREYPGTGFEYLGLLKDNQTSAKVTIKLPAYNLEFSAPIEELRRGSKEVPESSGKPYKLGIGVYRTILPIKINPGDATNTEVFCYEISFGSKIEEIKVTPTPPPSPSGPTGLIISSKPFSLPGAEFKLEGSPTIVASVTNLEELVKQEGLKIEVNGKPFKLMPNYGRGDRAVPQSIGKYQCVIRVVSGSMGRFFDVTVSMRGNDIVISNVREVSKQEYSRDVARQTGFI